MQLCECSELRLCDKLELCEGSSKFTYKKAYHLLLGQYAAKEEIKSLISRNGMDRKPLKESRKRLILYGMAQRGDVELFKVC